MGDVMFCDNCRVETGIRHGIDVQRGVWLCPRCFRIYKSLKKQYSKIGYDKERILNILKSVVEKQKNQGAWLRSS
jgi:hypothetical protein